MDEKEHEIWNDRMARTYDPDAFITKSGFFIRWVESVRMRKTIEAMKIEPHHAVLDVGCGPGNLLEQLTGRQVVGVDLSDTLVAQAKKRVAGRAGFEVIKGNIEHMEFPDSTFDRVVCSEVLEHVRNPEAVIEEIRRVAKPGARIVVTVPNESLINATKRIVLLLGLKKFIAGEYPMSDDMLEEWHMTEMSSDWVEKRFREKFLIEKKIHVPFFPLAYHYIFSILNNAVPAAKPGVKKLSELGENAAWPRKWVLGSESHGK